MNYKEGIQRKDWTKWTINSIQGMSYGAFFFNGQHVSEKELKELMADENVNFDYDDFVDYLNKNFNGDELGKLLKNNIVFPFGVTEVGMHCILDMEELQTYSSSVEEGKLIVHFDLYDNITDEVWNFGCKVIFNVEIPNYNMMLEKKSLKESNFKKSDAKVALQNVLKNGEEFDIPFKYSDEWAFTDAIEDELERRGFSFENSFRDKNYGSVEEYSDELETVYVIMDRSLSNRGICVGLVTEL